jgi:hypothetical protein
MKKWNKKTVKFIQNAYEEIITIFKNQSQKYNTVNYLNKRSAELSYYRIHFLKNAQVNKPTNCLN